MTVEAMGLETAQGIRWTTSFYWDRNQACREWTARFKQLYPSTPTRLHAGTYSAVLHYLAAMRDADPAVAARMKATPSPTRYSLAPPSAPTAASCSIST